MKYAYPESLHHPVVPEAELGGFNRSEFQQYLRRMVELVVFNDDEDRIEHVFQASSFQYTPWPRINDLEANRQQLVQVRASCSCFDSLLLSQTIAYRLCTLSNM